VPEFLNLCNLQSVPFQATYHTLTCDSTLDVICSNCSELLIAFGQTPACGFSAHDLIFATFDLSVPRNSKQTKTFRNFSKINADNLLLDVDNAPWAEVYNEQNMDCKLEKFNSILNSLMDKHAPVQTMTFKQDSAPWMNKDIRSLLTKRNRLRKKFNRTKCTIALQNFRTVRNRVKQLIRSAKMKYFYSRFEAGKDSRSLWATVRSLNIKSAPQLIDPVVNVNELNAHYASVSTVRNAQLINDTIQDYESRPQHELKTGDKFHFKYVLPGDILEAINSIKSKATGVDNIPVTFLKLCIPALLPVLDHIFNFSLQNGIFPSMWKLANILPIPKCKNPKESKDYRPVSILCVLGKILEKLVHKQVSEFLSENNLYAENQSGFRKGYSTKTALLKVIDDVRAAIDKRLLTLLVLLDLSKAFDCVHHDLLLCKLKHLGFSESAIKWFKSYLGSRRHRVFVSDSQFSEWADIMTGVPQGSVLGPLLFLIYLFDLPKVLKSCFYLMYADDIQLYIHFPIGDFNTYLALLICDIVNAINLFESHNLVLNVAKTMAIILGTQRYLTLLESAPVPPLNINGYIVPYSSSVNNLGVLFDQTLSWTNYCTSLAQKIFAILAQLRRMFSFIPPNVRRILIMTLVMPHLDYASLLLTDITDCNNLKLQKLQNACVRFITGASRFEHISPYYEQLGLLKLDKRRIIGVAIMIFKIMTTGTPSYLRDKYAFIAASSTRSSEHKLVIPNHRTEKYHLSFLVQSSKLWNELKLFELAGRSVNFVKLYVERYLSSNNVMLR
jgi:hypothetical protein